MNSYLADVNVWVALAYSAHEHNKAAVEWFESDEVPIFFCRVTQQGLLRLLTNRQVMGDDVRTPSSAWDLYDLFYADYRIKFAPEPPELERFWRDTTQRPTGGPNFWTDAYLAAFAAASGMTIVTFDRGFTRHRRAPVRVLPA